MRAIWTLSTFATLLILVDVVGCGRGVDEPIDVLLHRKLLLVSDEPAGAIPVSEARNAIGADEPVVVLGRIHAAGHQPWDEGRAAFVISDPATLLEDSNSHHDAPGHDPDKCPFCKRANSQGDVLTIVRFKDERGNVLPIDARRLLDVQENQLVVVRGRAELDEFGNVALDADSIYVRR